MRFLQFSRRMPGRHPLWLLVAWTGMQRIVWLTMKLLYHVRLRGAENVPERGPLIYAVNHQSHLDPALAGILVRDRPFASMARSSLFRFPPFAWLIRFLGAVPLQRGAADTAAMRALLAELEAGRCVLVFPEGRRTPDGSLGPFNPGVLLLIRRSGAAVVPVAIEGAFDVWPRHRTLPKVTGRIAVQAGAPIEARTLVEAEPGAALDRLRRAVEAIRLEARAELRRATGGRRPAPGPADVPYWESGQRSAVSRDGAQPELMADR